MAEPAAVSVVIPVLGDAAPLARLVGQLRALTPPPAEVLVVDGAGSAQCCALCAREGAAYTATRAGRGHQLHHGAMRSRGDVLWFVHADAEVPGGAVAAIRAAIAAGAAGGHFRFRFAGAPAWHKALLAALINLRARYGVPYGDQGIFATRAAYAAAGGFPDVPLFEEVELVKGLRRAGRFVTVRAAIGVSPRRWERDGWLRRTLENRLLALAYMAGVRPERLAARYRGADQS
jgi:rSAM/selenodomain-associated transferase 2